jgi:A/G-specific adenine glycosylase
LLDLPDLTGWFDVNGRDLPWRRTRDPWAIAVSELMLQQTQVARVETRWPRFLQRFPTAAACAAAAPGDVIDEWAGLGYNRRALNLHRMAVQIVEDHGGVVPAELDQLLALPGIGPYTARAIRAFAFELPAAVLDTNVARILARVEGRPLGRAEAQRLADRWAGLDATADQARPADPWTWNQAMLDVGAGHCRATNTDCSSCPFQPGCRWSSAGCAEPDPAAGSAGVSKRQSRFEGSDRQGRGRLLDALRSAPVLERDVARAMGWPDDQSRATRVSEALIAEGLVERRSGRLELPR